MREEDVASAILGLVTFMNVSDGLEEKEPPVATKKNTQRNQRPPFLVTQDKENTVPKAKPTRFPNSAKHIVIAWYIKSKNYNT